MEDTLLENIRMGTNATEEQVRQAAKAAQIDDFIMSLPNGYLTQIGDEGVTVRRTKAEGFHCESNPKRCAYCCIR